MARAWRRPIETRHRGFIMTALLVSHLRSSGCRRNKGRTVMDREYALSIDNFPCSRAASITFGVLPQYLQVSRLQGEPAYTSVERREGLGSLKNCETQSRIREVGLGTPSTSQETTFPIHIFLKFVNLSKKLPQEGTSRKSSTSPKPSWQCAS